MKNTKKPVDMREFAFVVTKPLQFLFAAGIIRQLGISDQSFLVVTNSFRDAEAVCERASRADWDLSSMDIRFCADRSEAEQYATRLGVRTLFVDSDVGLRRFLLLLKTQLGLKRPQIWVYEEGLGSYRTDLYKQDIKHRLFDALGIGTHFGGSRLTRGIYVCEPSLFRERFPDQVVEVRKIARTPCEIIEGNLKEWSRIFDYVPVSPSSETACALYLTDWSVHPDGVARLNEFPGDKYMKPHPHIKEIPAVTGVELISATPPAELVLIDLLGTYQSVTVFHHGSSCEKYVGDQRVSYVLV